MKDTKYLEGDEVTGDEGHEGGGHDGAGLDEDGDAGAEEDPEVVGGPGNVGKVSGQELGGSVSVTSQGERYQPLHRLD